MSAPLVIGPIAMAVFIAGMWIGHPLHKRWAQARADAMVNHLLSGLAPDPGEIRKHRRPRGWNDADGRMMSRYHGQPGKGARTRVQEQKRLEAEARNQLTPVHRRRATCRAAEATPKHTSDAIAGGAALSYPGRHAYGNIHLVVGIEARAAYDAAVLTVQSVVDSVRRGRMWMEATS